MNKTLGFAACALLLATSHASFAASTVDLTVKGLIVPSACVPALDGGGTIDIGKISAKDLNQDTSTQVASNTLQMTVTCEGKTLIALNAIDNRAGSAIDTDGYGLGLINSNQKLGKYTLGLLNPQADSVAAQTIASTDGGLTWGQGSDWTPGLYMSVAAPSDLSVPIPVQIWNVELVVNTIIAAASTLDLTNEVQIDGLSSREVKDL